MTVETRCHAIRNADGSVAIMQTVRQPDGSWPKVEDCLAKWVPIERARVVDHAAIAREDVPADRTFRNAWTFDGKVIVHDMAKARDILRARLRMARVAELNKLDMDYLRADEAKDDAAKAAVAAQKQKLRDVPAHPLIDAAATVEDLKRLTLDVLTRQENL